MKLKLKKGWMCTECGQGYTSWFKAVRCHTSPVKYVYVTISESKSVRVVRGKIKVMTDQEAEDDTFGLITDLTEGV